MSKPNAIVLDTGGAAFCNATRKFSLDLRLNSQKMQDDPTASALRRHAISLPAATVSYCRLTHDLGRLFRRPTVLYQAAERKQHRQYDTGRTLHTLGQHAIGIQLRLGLLPRALRKTPHLPIFLLQFECGLSLAHLDLLLVLRNCTPQALHLRTHARILLS